MPNFIKRFAYVKENHAYFLSIFQGFIYLMNNKCELVYCAMSWSKSRLKTIKKTYIYIKNS
jgi:hypothetical protein